MTNFNTYYFLTDYKSSIGEMVDSNLIDCFNDVIFLHGEEYFQKLISDDEAIDVAYAYIHPHDDMRTTKNFDIIQRAFINSYT